MYAIGVDVGTQSVRAGLVQVTTGVIKRTHVVPIQIWNPQKDHYEQSSDEIWEATCTAIRNIMKEVDQDAIVGIGFDATCSLVAIDAETNKPVSLSTTKNEKQNVILWMDHRAIEQAKRINEGKYDVVKYVGGVISPEMETPKLLWIKENLPNVWKKVKFFDLADFLVYSATGVDVRSLCTVTCWLFEKRVIYCFNR
jgi:FGGY-family pentulose kinase